MFDTERMAVANQVLPSFCKYSFVDRRGRLCLEYPESGPVALIVEPTMYLRSRVICGGNSERAIASLARWVRHQNTYSLTQWRYWAGDTIKLFRDSDIDPIKILREAGYPERSKCVFCGEIPNRVDWYNLGDVIGYGCMPECQAIKDVRKELYDYV